MELKSTQELSKFPSEYEESQNTRLCGKCNWRTDANLTETKKAATRTDVNLAETKKAATRTALFERNRGLIT
jgi:hypothetical protein